MNGHELKEKFTPHRIIDWWREPIEDLTWLLDDLLPAGAMVMMSGPRKRGYKTWLALSMSMALASGRNYGNVFKPVAPKRVLFVEEEGTRPDTRDRVGKVMRMLDINPASLNVSDPFYDNFLWFHHLRLKLDNPVHVSYLIKLVKQYGIELIVLDALTYMHDVDENSKKDMQILNNALMNMRSTGCTVLYLVHTNKASDREEADIDTGVRGSSVMLDAYDAHFALRRLKPRDNLVLTVRYRDHEETQFDISWKIEKDQSGKAQLIISPRNSESRQVDIVDTLVDRGFMAGQPYTFKQFREALDLPSGLAAEKRGELIDTGKILLSKDGNQIIIP